MIKPRLGDREKSWVVAAVVFFGIGLIPILFFEPLADKGGFILGPEYKQTEPLHDEVLLPDNQGVYLRQGPLFRIWSNTRTVGGIVLKVFGFDPANWSRHTWIYATGSPVITAIIEKIVLFLAIALPLSIATLVATWPLLLKRKILSGFIGGTVPVALYFLSFICILPFIRTCSVEFTPFFFIHYGLGIFIISLVVPANWPRISRGAFWAILLHIFLSISFLEKYEYFVLSSLYFYFF